MDIEQRGGTFRRLLREDRREGAGDRLAAHTYIDARGLRNDGPVSFLNWSRKPIGVDRY
jgi:hypothetical protein